MCGYDTRNLLGHNLGSCSMDELEQIENRLERSINSIRARKVATSLYVYVMFNIFVICSYFFNYIYVPCRFNYTMRKQKSWYQRCDNSCLFFFSTLAFHWWFIYALSFLYWFQEKFLLDENQKLRQKVIKMCLIIYILSLLFFEVALSILYSPSVRHYLSVVTFSVRLQLFVILAFH